MKAQKFTESAFRRGPCVLLLLTAVLTACSKPADRESTESASQAQSSPDASNAQAGRMVKLDSKMQQLLQLKTEALTAVAINPDIKSYGRVLDPAPLAALVAELTGAQAALTASANEYSRAQMLLDQSNASVRTVQAAEAAAVRDRSLVQSARDRIALAWGTALLQRANLSALVRDLTALKAEIVRIDVPLGEQLADPPHTARLVPIADETRSTIVDFLGFAPATDPQLQGQGLLYLANTNPLHLTPAAAVIGYLPQHGAPLRGVRLPRSALIRYEAQSWAYVQKDENSFERIPIQTTHPVDGGWLVTMGLKAGDRVVAVGAQILLSEELKSQVRLQE